MPAGKLHSNGNPKLTYFLLEKELETCVCCWCFSVLK